MRGRKPDPTRLKLLKGNPGKRHLNELEPDPRRIIPSPPEHMTQEALVHWGRFSTLLDQMGVLTEADGAALEQLCLIYQEMIELRVTVKDLGRQYKQDNGMMRPNPAVAMLADADRRFRGYLSDFGLTPAARPRVQAERKATSKDPAERHFG